MPRNSIVATRYTRALIEARGGTKGLDACFSELKAFWQSLSASPEFEKFFLSPVVPRDLKVEAINDLRATLKESADFLVTLIDGARLKALPEVIESISLALEEAAGEMSVTVELARAPQDGMLDEIRSVLQDRWQRKIKMTTVVRPELIGGFVARGAGKILDASVATQLGALKQSLSSHS
jgi:F-type H+-transporting ATPase subunit delta